MHAMSIQWELECIAVLGRSNIQFIIKNTLGTTSSLDWPFDWDWVSGEVGENLRGKKKKGSLPQLLWNQDTLICHCSKQLKGMHARQAGNLEKMLSFWPNCPCLPFVFFHSIWLGVWLRIWLGVWLLIWVGVWCKPSQTSFFLCLLINSRAHGQPKSEKQQKVGLNTCLIKLPMIWGISYIIAAKRVIETSLPYPFVSAALISLSPLICV